MFPRLCFRSSSFYRVHSPLSILPSLSLNHYLYADDYQLLFLMHYSPTKCSSADIFLDDRKTFNSLLVWDWISAHGTPKANCQIYTSTLNTTHSARNLGITIWRTFHLFDHCFLFKSLLWHCMIVANFAVTALTSIPQQPLSLSPPSLTHNLITVVVFTTTSLSLK